MKQHAAPKAVKAILLIYAFNACICFVSAGPETAPDHKDIRYSKKYKRSTLDVWLSEGTNKVPLVVYFHGGGFKNGDKSRFQRKALLRKHRSKGIAFASVNYPFVKDAGYVEIMAHAAKSIKFIRSRSNEWRIDAENIAVMGTSAGAMIAEYITYWTDSGIKACYAEQQPHHSWFLLACIREGSPPLMLYTWSGKKDRVHNPDHAIQFKKHCDKFGVECKIYGSGSSGLPSLPEGTSIEAVVMRFFRKRWKKSNK